MSILRPLPGLNCELELSVRAAGFDAEQHIASVVRSAVERALGVVDANAEVDICWRSPDGSRFTITTEALGPQRVVRL